MVLTLSLALSGTFVFAGSDLGQNIRLALVNRLANNLEIDNLDTEGDNAETYMLDRISRLENDINDDVNNLTEEEIERAKQEIQRISEEAIYEVESQKEEIKQEVLIKAIEKIEAEKQKQIDKLNKIIERMN